MNTTQQKLPNSPFLQKKIKLETKKKFIKEDEVEVASTKKEDTTRYDKRDVTIYIGNLNYRKDEESIKKMFSPFGKVKDVYILVDAKTKLKKGIAFVRMYKNDEAQKAINYLNGREIDGRTLKVSKAIESKK